MEIDAFYKQATGHAPYPYQVRLATCEMLPQLLSVPTGVGKTAAASLAWVYRRRFSDDATRKSTPRRLVYCLPMRTLVEQTRDAVEGWLKNLKIGTGSENGIAVQVLMGGEDAGRWYEHPEADQILIGTQDMLLSRALNRAYGMSRYAWPIHFGLLNNDCLWVMDETQLMGNGLPTTVQLDCFGKIWGRERANHYLWMSATLGEDFLRTTDREAYGVEIGASLHLENADFANENVKRRINATKQIEFAKSVTSTRIVKEHSDGRITLVIANTVPKAKAIHTELLDEIKKNKKFKSDTAPAICLLHSRFRSADREREIERILGFIDKVDPKTGRSNDAGLFIVSTQVIEAGFDISSAHLWSEIAPWASIVQRLGRLNREGLQPDAKAVFWMPKEDKDRENHAASPNAKRIGPYEKASLQVAKKLIEKLVEDQKEPTEFHVVFESIAKLKEAQAALEPTAEVVIRPRDFHELFGTEPDLDGGFTDVSHFVRGNDRNADIQVFWRGLDNGVPSETEASAARHELCSVPVFEIRKFVGGKTQAFEWNAEVSVWQSRRATDIHPGMTLLLSASSGGYSDAAGWTGDSKDRPSINQHSAIPLSAIDTDFESATDDWWPLDKHLLDVEAEAELLADELIVEPRAKQALVIAGRWHDWGKSLDRWQRAVREYAKKTCTKIDETRIDPEFADCLDVLDEWRIRWQVPEQDTLWAKFPDLRDAIKKTKLPFESRKRLYKQLYVPFRPNLRHEAASALGALDCWLQGDEDLSALAVYLVASHHGKVRTTMRRMRKGREIFGLDSSDVLKGVDSVIKSEREMNFECAKLGASGTWNTEANQFTITLPSWAQVIGELLGQCEPASQNGTAISNSQLSGLGPNRLAFYEALVRVADVRASQHPGRGFRS